MSQHARITQSLEVDSPPLPRLTLAQAVLQLEILAGRLNHRAVDLQRMNERLAPGMRPEGDIDDDTKLDLAAIDTLVRLGRFAMRNEADMAEIARREKAKARGNWRK